MEEGKASLSVRFKEFSDRFDRFTKEQKIFGMILTFVMYFVFYLLLEGVFNLLYMYINGDIFDVFNLTKVSVPASIMTAAFVYIFPSKAQRVVFPVTAVLWLVYMVAQLMVVISNGSLFRLKAVFTAKNAMQFADGVFAKVRPQMWGILAAVVVVIVAVEIAVIKFAKNPKNRKVGAVRYIISAAALIIPLAAISFYTPSEMDTYRTFVWENFSDFNSVYSMSDLYTYVVRDVANMATQGARSKENREKQQAFYDSLEPHKDNEMTGALKGKNLIVVQMESLEDSAMREEVAPNIVKLMEESVVFDNYYAMRFGTEPTICNETAVNTGLYVPSGVSPSHDFYNFKFDNSLAAVFTENGYTANSFDATDESFYNRDKVEVTFGYEKYNQYGKLTDEDLTFEDDFNIANCDDVYKAYTSGDNFLNYVITYSGHPPYFLSDLYDKPDWNPGVKYNSIIARHPEIKINVKKRNEDPIYELFVTATDDFVGRLMERLEEDGRLDDTAVLFLADHANLTHIGNAEAKGGADSVKAHAVPCFLYAKGLEPRHVDKVCSNIDILPTVINLFGMESDYEYIGSDIFSQDYEGIAFLPNLSWVTNKCMCVDGAVVESYTDEEITDEYVDSVSQKVMELVGINDIIMFDQTRRD